MMVQSLLMARKSLVSASCVMPLSGQRRATGSPDIRQMGLRHRAALGISEGERLDCIGGF